MLRSLANRIFRPAVQGYLQNDFVKKFSTVLGVDILVKASGFILLPLFLRLMSQEEFGLYNYLFSIIQTFSLVLNLGLYIPQSKLYHTCSSRDEKGQLLFTISVTLFLFLALLIFLLGVSRLDYTIVNFLFETHFDYAAYRGIILLALVITVCSFMLTNFFYTSEKIRLVKRYNIFRIVFVNLLALVALYLFNSDAVRVRVQFTYLTELVLFCLFVPFFIREVLPRFDKRLMWKSIRMGFPIMLSAIFGIAVNFSDKFLLQKYGSLQDLSNYYLAFSFASIIPLIFGSLQNVWLPVFMKERDVEKNFEKTKKLISKLVLLFVVLSIAIWIGFVFLVRTSVIPYKYANGIGILPLLLLAQICTSIASLLSNYLVYFEKTIWVTFSGLLVGLLSVGVGLWLVPLWGVYGAATVALMVNLVYMLFYYGLIVSIKRKLYAQL